MLTLLVRKRGSHYVDIRRVKKTAKEQIIFKNVSKLNGQHCYAIQSMPSLNLIKQFGNLTQPTY